MCTPLETEYSCGHNVVPGTKTCGRCNQNGRTINSPPKVVRRDSVICNQCQWDRYFALHSARWAKEDEEEEIKKRAKEEQEQQDPSARVRDTEGRGVDDFFPPPGGF